MGDEAGPVVGIICNLGALKLQEDGVLSQVSWEAFVRLQVAGAMI